MQGDFHIGERLVQPRINSIQYNGNALHLEPKVMQVLLVLASKPGEVFSREDIRQVVWRDVFVGDDVLMRAVSEIRRVFEDNPQSPHTIQTVPKVGYRLIAPVAQQRTEAAADAPLEKVSDASALLPNEPTMPGVLARLELQAPLQRPSWHRGFWLAAALSVGLIMVAALVLLLRARHPEAAAASYVSHPLTTYPGSQLQPALSPAGDAVAFVWNQTGHDGHQLYIKALQSGAPVRVTTGEDQEFSPAWSPDGLSLAFISQSAAGSSVDVIPALGGSERQVYAFPLNSVGEYGGLAWSSDGKQLIFPELQRSGGPSQLVELSLDTHAVRVVTYPPSNWNGDSMPAVSPDGKWLAFARGSEQSTRDIFVMNLADGTLRQVTTDARLILGLVWTSDGSNIVFSSDRGGSLALWRVSPGGGPPERDLAGTDGASWPTVSKRGDLLAYSHGSATWSIASVPIDPTKREQETNILVSSEQDSSPSLSPTGNLLAFQSWRSGSQEIWTAAAGGSNPTQLTNQNASAGSPAWSRDGRLIAFDARSNGFAHIYITDIGGASPRALTSGRFNDIVPGWSADDHWIYFGSNRSETWQIWRVSADRQGAPQQITSSGGMIAKPSADGKWLYFTKAAAGLWRRPIDGGEEKKIFEGPSADYLNYWTVCGNDVCTLSSEGGHPVLVRVDPGSGRVTDSYRLIHDPAPFSGVTVSADGKEMLFSELLEARSNLTLVEHFH